MRWLVRSLIFWAICAPLFYMFGLPKLMVKLETKARTENYAACQTHLKDEHLAGVPTAIINDKEADKYCHCVSDSIALTNADLFDLARKRQPARLEAVMKPIVEACNKTLQDKLTRNVISTEQPYSTFEKDGTETVRFR